jgi:hypothetical protein
MAKSSRLARARRQPSSGAGGGDAVYALGLIGAVVYFWQQADTFGEHVVALLKALVWPAFLVYEAFQSLLG